MAGTSGGARRANDDGALIARSMQTAIPKLSLRGAQPEEQEQELGQPLADAPRLASSRMKSGCPWITAL